MQAFQDLMPFNHCFGCGPNNEKGLQLKSYWKDPDGDRAVATWRARPEHAAGPVHVLNGGIISTLMDCHGICTAVADGYRLEGRRIGDDGTIWCVTANLQVRYLRPTLLATPVHLEATISRRDGRKTAIRVSVTSRGEITAEGEILALRVEPTWLEP